MFWSQMNIYFINQPVITNKFVWSLYIFHSNFPITSSLAENEFMRSLTKYENANCLKGHSNSARNIFEDYLYSTLKKGSVFYSLIKHDTLLLNH